jgi:hypothetical protein
MNSVMRPYHTEGCKGDVRWDTTSGWLDSDGYMEFGIIRLPRFEVRAPTTQIFTGNVRHLLFVLIVAL